MGGWKCATGGQARGWGLGHAACEGRVGFTDEMGGWENRRTGVGRAAGRLGRRAGNGWWRVGEWAVNMGVEWAGNGQRMVRWARENEAALVGEGGITAVMVCHDGRRCLDWSAER